MMPRGRHTAKLCQLLATVPSNQYYVDKSFLTKKFENENVVYVAPKKLPKSDFFETEAIEDNDMTNLTPPVSPILPKSVPKKRLFTGLEDSDEETEKTPQKTSETSEAQKATPSAPKVDNKKIRRTSPIPTTDNQTAGSQGSLNQVMADSSTAAAAGSLATSGARVIEGSSSLLENGSVRSGASFQEKMKRVQYIINRAPNLGITLEKELKLLLAYDDEVKKYAKIFNICNFWATVKEFELPKEVDDICPQVEEPQFVPQTIRVAPNSFVSSGWSSANGGGPLNNSSFRYKALIFSRTYKLKGTGEERQFHYKLPLHQLPLIQQALGKISDAMASM